MALGKRVKVAGSFYKGYVLAVAGAANSDHVLDMTVTTSGSAVTGITVIPDTYDAEDYFKLEHFDENNVLSPNSVKGVIAETIFNVGANAAIIFDLAALQLFDVNHKLRLTYHSKNGVSLTVHTIVERIR